jgi:hypothetical protein
MAAVVGLSVAVVVVSSDDAPSTSDVIATGKFAPEKNPSGTTRYDGGPEEGTRGAAVVSSAPVPTVAPRRSAAAPAYVAPTAPRRENRLDLLAPGRLGGHVRADGAPVADLRVRVVADLAAAAGVEAHDDAHQHGEACDDQPHASIVQRIGQELGHA